MSEGTLQNQHELSYPQLDVDAAHTKTRVLRNEVLHYDETGFYVGKERFWEHVASNERFTYLFVHRQRGKEAHKKTFLFYPIS